MVGLGQSVTVDWIRVGSLAEIPDGEIRAFELSAGRVAVAHVDHRLFGVGDECTHAGCSLAEGELIEHDEAIRCPCHGSAFDLETGEPIEGPARDPVPVFVVREVDGWVEVARTRGVAPGMPAG
jgi:3-phenylpropionate/trans-cinnamate dioxygenase ferredoxin component